MRRSVRAITLVLLCVVLTSHCGGDNSSGPPGTPPPSNFVRAFGDKATGVALLSNGTRVVTGQTVDSLMIRGYGGAGTLRFARSFDGAASDLGSVAAIGGDQFMAAGSFQSTVSLGANVLTSSGLFDMFLARFDKDGNPIWAVSAGGSDLDLPWDLTVDVNGDVLVTGYFRGTAGFGGTQLTSGGFSDGFIAKYSGLGDVRWVTMFGGPGYADIGEAIVADDSLNVFVAGRFTDAATFDSTPLTSHGDQDVFVAKYYPDGTKEWVRGGGGPELDNTGGLGLDASGHVIVAGAFKGDATFGSTSLTSAGDYDIFVAEYDRLTGALLWARRYGGTGNDHPVALATEGNRLFICGNFDGSLTLGTRELTTAGYFDAFMAELDPTGGVVWAERCGGPNYDFAGEITRIPGHTILCGESGGDATFGSLHLNDGGGFIYQR